MEKQKYKFLIEEKSVFLINIKTKKKEYEVVCINEEQNLIKVNAIEYIDTKQMYISSIDAFDSNSIRNVLPECYI